jgi:hypothetical protein
VRRLEGFAAIGFAVAYVVALVLTNVPDEGESRREAMDFYNSAGDKWRELIAVYVMATAGMLFVTFLALFASRLLPPARPVALISGGAFAALYLASAAAFIAPTLSLSLDSTGANAADRQFVDFARGMSTLGDAFLLVVSMFAAATFVGALAWSQALPRWLVLSGWVVAIACLFGFTFVPLLLFALWMLLLGATSVRGPAGVAPAGPGT